MPPPIATRLPVATLRHGETYVDEFAWLRERNNPQVRNYLEAENDWARQVLAPTEQLQEKLYEEMLGRIVETDLSVPSFWNGWWYYSRTEEGKQYPIHCRRRGTMDADEALLLDLNQMAGEGEYIALGSFAVSDDGWRLAYSLDRTGYRQYTLHCKDLESGDILAITRERVTSVAWDADSSTLWYAAEDEVTKRSDEVRRLDLTSDADELAWHEDDETMNVGVGRSRSRDWLMIGSSSHTTSEVRVREAGSGGSADEWRIVLGRVAEREYDLEHQGSDFCIRINDTGRNFRLVRLPTSGGKLADAVEVVPHRPEVMLEGVSAFAGHLVLHEREDALPQIAIHPVDSDEPPHRISFEQSIYECYPGSNPEYDTTNYRFGYQSPIEPMSVWQYDISSRERTLLKQHPVKGGHDPSKYITRRIHALATDGTRVPVSVVHRADLAVDGSAPTLLTGYGSYGYPYPVTFSSNRLSLLDRGVVVAIAHIRGGGELGKAWHDAGRLSHKMNSFTDFLASADALVAEGLVDPGRIAIEGGSAGGLLMGAVVNLAPQRFRAVLSQVPFVDVINTMSDATLPLTIGEYEEWGNPEVEEQHRWMQEYDPYLNLRPGPFPVMLVRTSLNDSQVMYWEPAKYVARIRMLRTNDTPVLLLTNMGAGHGGASGRYDHLREVATDYAFLLAALGVEGELARRSEG